MTQKIDHFQSVGGASPVFGQSYIRPLHELDEIVELLAALEEIMAPRLVKQLPDGIGLFRDSLFPVSVA